MSIELTLIHGSPYAWRVQLALEWKQVPYETRVLSISKGELATPEFLALSPRGKVPVLRSGDFLLTESLAMLVYLERRFPERPLFGTTAEEEATIWRKISEYTSYVDSAVEAFVLPFYFGRAEKEVEGIKGAITELTPELARYDDTLRRTPYLAGSILTAVDLCVFPHVQSILRAASKPAAREFSIPFLPLEESFPAIRAWLDKIAAIPGYERTYPPNWR